MSGIKPARRWQPAFYPFSRESAGKRLLAGTERIVKGTLFGCRMCGNCLLQETALICPMECPKGMRNGPCGSVREDKRCYVDNTRKCIWNAIYERSFRTGRQERLLEVLPPLDWSKTGGETWGDVVRQVKTNGTGRFFKGILSGKKDLRDDVWESVFKTVRQPRWWNGDSEYHAPQYKEPVSELERRLKSGAFVFATELTPPTGSVTGKLERDITMVKPYVSAINFTDSSSARPKMSSMACSTVAIKCGAEPVLQIAARDTTRTGLQASAVGVNAIGIKNILCVSGDNPVIGDSPVSNMNVLDLDSVQMLWILRRMRDEGRYLDGREFKNRPAYFLGAATTPTALAPKMQAVRDQKKVNAGAQFFQTNLIFDPGTLDPWLEELDKRNVLDKVYIMGGIAPLKNFKVAEYLHTKVPGVTLPHKLLERMEKAGEDSTVGIDIALELIDSLKRKKGINGIHIMTLGWEDAVAEIVKGSGISGK
jgi:methylenetetrahydrofolate reductase (NADPH)